MSYTNYRDRELPGVVQYATDLLRYRHLCWNLVGSDLRSRFRGSRIGIFWAVIQPLGYAIILAWAWGSILKVPSYLEFAIYVFSGMVVWEYFSVVVNTSMDGLINAVGYLRQSRVPFFVFQLRVPLSGLVIFGAGIIGLIILMFGVQLIPNSGVTIPPPGLHLLLIPAFMGIMIVVMAPLAVLFSILGAQLRDLKYIMGLVLQAMVFLSPIMIQRHLLDDSQLSILRYINPLVPIIDMFRAPILYGKFWEPTDMLILSIWTGIFWVLAATASIAAGRKIVFAV
jgi:ABC-type polysaccharide/polyol phosphate export permease